MNRKRLNFLKNLVNFGLIFLFLWAILSITPSQSPWRGVLLLLWGAISLAKMNIYFRKRKFSLILAYINLHLGSSLLIAFGIWAVNMILKVFNPLITWIGWNFQIGNLFPEGMNYVFSIPALIAGLLLVVAAYLSQSDAKYHILRYVLEFGGGEFRT